MYHNYEENKTRNRYRVVKVHNSGQYVEQDVTFKMSRLKAQ